MCSGLQKYCPDCQGEAHKTLDNKQGIEYYYSHYGTEAERDIRSAKRRAYYAEHKDEINKKRRERLNKNKEEKS